ncbi:MAG TPA: glycosyltransferase [Rhizomicrobium sp.]|nr:glycosyltransferase [Rhizomicrobium sp.]
MAGNYRGVLKVAGPVLKGWLIDIARPSRRVAFDLVIDGEKRGAYVADARRRFFSPRQGAGEDTHGFTIPIRRPWISGAFQSVTLEAPGLAVSMSAKLGPKPHQHFDDHVIGSQVSIGGEGAARARPDGEPQEAETRDVETRGPNRVLLRQIANLPDADLVGLLAAIDREVLAERLTRHEKEGDWEKLAQFRRVVAGGANEKLLVTLGRAAIKSHNYGFAARLTAAAAALHPQSFEANYLAGSARSLLGEFDESLRYLRAADRLEEGGTRAKREMTLTLSRQLREDLPIARRAQIRDEHLAMLRALSQADDVAIRLKYRVPYATALYAAGRYDEAVAAADAILQAAPNDTRALMVKARTLVARNAVAEAHGLYERILELEPGHRGASTALRILAALIEDETRPQDSGATVARLKSLADLAGTTQTWISLGEDGADDPQALAGHAARRTGCVRDGARELWHREALKGLAESGLIASLDRTALARWRSFYEARAETRRGIAVLVSCNGADLYGGGEHFLEDAAAHHEAQGYEPVILGTRPELQGERRTATGRRAVFIGEQPSELRRFVLENGATLVHAISGMGFAAAEALAFTNIPLVYGVHFWNELLGDPQYPGYFDEVSGDALFRREFLVILSRARAIYANSRYTQKIIEDGFGVRCPVLHAAPRDASLTGRDVLENPAP